MYLMTTNPFLPSLSVAAITRFQKQPLLQTSLLGLFKFIQISQGSSFLATLGWRTQSLWDCSDESSSESEFVAAPYLEVVPE